MHAGNNLTVNEENNGRADGPSISYINPVTTAISLIRISKTFALSLLLLRLSVPIDIPPQLVLFFLRRLFIFLIKKNKKAIKLLKNKKGRKKTVKEKKTN